MRADRLITLCLARLLAAPGRETGVLPILMYHSLSREPESGVHPYYQVRTHPEVFARHMDWLAAHGYRGMDLETALAQCPNAPATPEPECARPRAQQASKGQSVESGSNTGLWRDVAAPKDGRTPAGSSPSPPATRGERDGVRGDSFMVPKREVSVPGILSPQPQPVAITFDDGFQDVLTEAWPALSRHGFTATVFLPTAFIGDQTRRFQNRACLTWAEVRELRRGGLRFGSHTVHHEILYDLDWPRIQPEITDSKLELEQRLGERVTSFAYPFAYPQSDHAYVARLSALLRESGYESCVTTRVGRARRGDSPYTLKRLPANTLDDDRLFAAKLRGAYDWVAAAQSGAKWVRHRLTRGRARVG